MKRVELLSQKSVELSSLCDVFGLPDGWVLCAWPISYNGAVSFIFRDAEEGDVETEGGDKSYHFKICTASDFSFSHVQQKDIELEGLALMSVFFWEHGYAMVVRDEVNCTSVVLHDKQDKVVTRINVGQDVCRLMVARDGRVVVGYAGNMREISPCFAVYDKDGRELYACRDDAARACMDITIDNENNVWASCFPGVSTYKITPEMNVEKINYPIASSGGLIPVRINGIQRLIQIFGDDECCAPMNYLPMGDELYEVRFDGMRNRDIDASSAYAGAAILLTKYGKLCFFDLDKVGEVLPGE